MEGLRHRGGLELGVPLGSDRQVAGHYPPLDCVLRRSNLHSGEIADPQRLMHGNENLEWFNGLVSGSSGDRHYG